MSETLSFRESLLEKQYAPVGVDLGLSDYQEAIKAFQEFMQLPNFVTNAANFQLDSRVNTKFGVFQRQVGGVNSEGRGLDQDNKDIFHYGAASSEIMRRRLDSRLPAEVDQFLTIAEEIYRQSTASLRNTLQELDHQEMGLVGIHFSNTTYDNHHVRFVAYQRREGALLATPHYDKSTATIALAENKPGFWIERHGHKEMLPPRVGEEGLFFLGRGWEELPINYLYGNEDLEPAYHGVDQITEENDDGVMRWAIILFANPSELDTTPAPEKTRPYKAMGQKVFESGLIAA